MITEAYGGKCPNCGYDRMLMRYGSFGYLQFDACPNCAFSFGTTINHNGKEIIHSDWEIWEIEIDYLKPSLNEKNLPTNLLGILLYIEDMPESNQSIGSVFDYNKIEERKWTK